MAQQSSPRVVRGGSFFSREWYVRAALRLDYGPDVRNDVLGFRAVVSPPMLRTLAVVIRGGSWNCTARVCRSAYRYWGRPNSDRSNILGFRVVTS